MIGHTGQIDGFTGAVAYLPDRDISTIVLANDDTFDARVVGRRLTAIALGEPYPDVLPVHPPLQRLEELAGTYRFGTDGELLDPESTMRVYLVVGGRWVSALP